MGPIAKGLAASRKYKSSVENDGSGNSSTTRQSDMVGTTEVCGQYSRSKIRAMVSLFV
jgi:hypothetical protein